MGWRESARAFERGLTLGQRARFHKDEMGLKEDLLEQRRKEWEAKEGRAKSEETRKGEKHEAWKKERDKKARFDVVKREVDTAQAMVKAGQNRQAAKKIVDLYNTQYPNQDEARIIFKEDDPGNKIWQQGNMKDKEIAMVTKQWGVLPAKNLKDVMKVVSSNLDYGQFTKDLEAVESAVAQKNAAEKPFQTREGDWFIQLWKEGPGGSVVKDGDPQPYTGETQVAGGEKKALEAGLDPEKLPKEDKQRLAGIREKIKEPKPGDIPTANKKKAEEFIKDLQILSKPFNKGNKEIIDPDTLEITSEGQSAWDQANELMQKYMDKKELSQEQRRKLDEAKQFLDVYDKIAKYTASKYGGRGKKGGRSWKDYAGNAPIKPKQGIPDQMAVSH